jgi:hypothetical protein
MDLETLKERILSLQKEFKTAESLVREREERDREAKRKAQLFLGPSYSPEPRVRTSPTLYANLKDIVANALKLLPDNRPYLETSWDQWGESVGEVGKYYLELVPDHRRNQDSR